MRRENGIVLALDVEDKDRALGIAGEVVDHIDAIKVGYPLILSSGMSVLREMKGLGKPVIADLKVADIPVISSRICKLASDSDYVIVHGFVGEDVVAECSKVASIFVVAEMSHPGAMEYMGRLSDELASMAARYAVGIIAPATRPDRVKRLRSIVGDLLILSPGVRAQGAGVGDAIRAGADYEIIGRGIYEADDPRRAAEGFSRTLKAIINSDESSSG
ncbi:MAG: orotidine-5'-phosphate decarboxylase [Candidatus Hydrothermarchaeaceae archaeon]